jgi:2,5-diketo-D-gluconate reductase A
MTQVPNFTLNDGNTIPQLGFAVFQIKPEDTADAVKTALGIG